LTDASVRFAEAFVVVMKHDVTPEIQKSDDDWRRQLGSDRYAILRQAATERPFTGSLLDVREDGTYRCGACGNELFTSDAKFDSHCGWPSFTRPEEQKNVRLLDDFTHGMHRVEVRCAKCDSHLGHVFDDGPGPEGSRYCINSLALEFAPRSEQ
jgi:methionine-R-sulfoxide reductase